MRIQRGGGVQTPPPPGKSQVIGVSIGNKVLDPPPPGKSWTPLENVGRTPSGTLKDDRFLWNWPFDFWGLKKKTKFSELFCQADLDPPWWKFLDAHADPGPDYFSSTSTTIRYKFHNLFWKQCGSDISKNILEWSRGKGRRMTIEIISWSISMKVWVQARIQLASLDLQSDSHLLPDTLMTVLPGPVLQTLYKNLKIANKLTLLSVC